LLTARRISLALAIIGAILLATEFPPEISVQPLPGPTLKVRLPVTVRFGGDYGLEVTMPKVGDALGLDFEMIPCDFSFTIERDGSEILSQHVQTISRGSEFGWAHTQQYGAGRGFHLSRGTYDVTIVGGSACPSAFARGASVTVVEQYKDRILESLLRYLSGRFFLFAGLLGLLISEFKIRRNKRA
jgi:hypothetical protein